MDAMITGYEKPLYILPFDHRHSYITGVFRWKEPLTPGQVADIVASKAVIYEGFKAAVADSQVRDRAGILVDEMFGAALLRDAAAQGYVRCVSTEKSGQDEFDFEYGDAFARHIEAVNPTFAKVLVRYNPDGDPTMNVRQAERLRRLSDIWPGPGGCSCSNCWCRRNPRNSSVSMAAAQRTIASCVRR